MGQALSTTERLNYQECCHSCFCAGAASPTLSSTIYPSYLGKVEHVAKIKTRDTVRALELLGKHTGAWEEHNKQRQQIILTKLESMV